MRIAKTQIFPIISVLVLLLPNVSLAIALNLDYPGFTIGDKTYDLNEGECRGFTDCQDLNQIVAWFYYFIISVAGIATFFMLVWGGFEWLTSAGSPARISSAKDRIYSALLGLLIILASWLILQVINPELTALRLPGL